MTMTATWSVFLRKKAVDFDHTIHRRSCKQDSVAQGQANGNILVGIFGVKYGSSGHRQKILVGIFQVKCSRNDHKGTMITHERLSVVRDRQGGESINDLLLSDFVF